MLLLAVKCVASILNHVLHSGLSILLLLFVLNCCLFALLSSPSWLSSSPLRVKCSDDKSESSTSISWRSRYTTSSATRRSATNLAVRSSGKKTLHPTTSSAYPRT
ncbi:hypothetical protein PF005_g32573 [Phytophthora fragariae]|uniref:Uncharacterized protein n=1 Tax=Phytophthora fragariae TaxID=53985 RepID=A0A6A3UZK2_9STRA|nr:hypothetical protein PF005_g32573 [Phytophthora fragariae]